MQSKRNEREKKRKTNKFPETIKWKNWRRENSKRTNKQEPAAASKMVLQSKWGCVSNNF